MASERQSAQDGELVASNIQQLADVLGVSARRVSEFIARGMPCERGGSGKAGRYPIAAAVQWCRSNVWNRRNATGDTRADCDLSDKMIQDCRFVSLLRSGMLSEAVVSMVEECNYPVEFSALPGEFQRVTDDRTFDGQTAIYRRDTQQVIWVQLAADLAATICDLVNTGRLFVVLSTPEEYLEACGQQINAPIATFDDVESKKDHWLPCALTTDSTDAVPIKLRAVRSPLVVSEA